MAEKKYEREEVVASYGTSGITPMYFPERRHDRVQYSRNVKIAGALIAILLVLAVAAITYAMTIY